MPPISREELNQTLAEAVVSCCQKLNEALTLGRPGDASDYSSALSSCAAAYDYVQRDEEETT